MSEEAGGLNYRLMQSATSAPAVSYYDYIIVGGGTAGCPLAATLSKNASVLVLERGGSPYGNPNITDLALFGAALSDLSPSSPSQRFISEDGVINARARVLGGGSCLNAGFYTRASTDYVRYIFNSFTILNMFTLMCFNSLEEMCSNTVLGRIIHAVIGVPSYIYILIHYIIMFREKCHYPINLYIA